MNKGKMEEEAKALKIQRLEEQQQLEDEYGDDDGGEDELEEGDEQKVDRWSVFMEAEEQRLAELDAEEESEFKDAPSSSGVRDESRYVTVIPDESPRGRGRGRGRGQGRGRGRGRGWHSRDDADDNEGDEDGAEEGPPYTARRSPSAYSTKPKSYPKYGRGAPSPLLYTVPHSRAPLAPPRTVSVRPPLQQQHQQPRLQSQAASDLPSFSLSTAKPPTPTTGNASIDNKRKTLSSTPAATASPAEAEEETSPPQAKKPRVPSPQAPQQRPPAVAKPTVAPTSRWAAFLQEAQDEDAGADDGDGEGDAQLGAAQDEVVEDEYLEE